MFVRDHARPVFHAALGFDPTQYDMQVFRITTEICKQVFPVTLDVDNPRFLPGMQRLLWISERIGASKGQFGLGGILKRVGLVAAAGVTLGRLFLMRPQRHELPSQVRMAPAW